MKSFLKLQNFTYYFGFGISILLFILHTLLVIFIKLKSYDFEVINSILFNNYIGLFKFDTMGVSWLYISSFIIFICQYFIFSKTVLKINSNYNWYAFQESKSSGWYILYLTLIQFSLTFLFLTDNVIIFYISFETTLLPFFLWIGEAALRSRKWHAVFFLTFFTLVGSIGMLWGIGILYKVNQSFIISDFEFSFLRIKTIDSLIEFNDFIAFLNSFNTVDIDFKKFEKNTQLFWFAFVLFTFSFLIKFPVFPIASWLPEAHVEASTEASVLLAAVLLKVAPFGFYKIIIPSFSIWYLEYKYILWIIGLFSSIIYVFALMSQTDLKRSIAYTSIIHMSIVLCLLGSESKTSLDSAFLMGVLHSYCSAGLFFCIGFLYDKDKSKSLHYISGLSQFRPIFSSFFFIFNLINVGYPLIGSYISESLLFVVSVYSNNYIAIFLIFLILYILTMSVFFMLSKILYKSWDLYEHRKILDLSMNESYVLMILFLFCTILGFFPSIYLNYVENSIFYIVEYLSCFK